MAIFSYQNLSAERILEAAQLSWAAYKPEYEDGKLLNPIPDQYTKYKPITLEQLQPFGLDESDFDGIYYKGGGGLAFEGARALLLISEDGKRVILAFRGTDNPDDILGILSQPFYLSAFDPLLKAVASYIQANNVSDVLVTGHSLGGTAANLLADVAGEQYGKAFKNADFVTFATPVISKSSDNILNIGHENDWVFSSVTIGRPSLPSTTDNIVYYDEPYNNPNNSIFDPDDISSHNPKYYTDTTNRVINSAFYDEMTRDSVVIVDAFNGAVSDKQSITSNHFGQPAYILGQENEADWLVGGTANDAIEGFSGGDKLYGGDGNDKLYGGPSNDTLSGGWGFDLLDGGEGEDTADYSFYTDSDGLKVDLGTGEVSFRPEHSPLPGEVEKLVSIENVIGGGGKDILIGSASNNTLSGGPGADVFVLSGGNDVIKDFEPGLGDLIRVPQGTDVQALFSVTADLNNNTVLTHPEGMLTLGPWGPVVADYWFEVA